MGVDAPPCNTSSLVMTTTTIQMGNLQFGDEGSVLGGGKGLGGSGSGGEAAARSVLAGRLWRPS